MTTDAAPRETFTLLDEVPAGELACRYTVLRKLREYRHFWYAVLTKPKEHQQFWYPVLGLGLAASAYFAAWGLHGNSSSTYRIDNQWGALAGLFILAHAIERAIEPFSSRLGPDTAKSKDEDKKMSRYLTAVVTWGVASGLAFLLCAKLNVTLMQAVRADGSGQPPFWADLLVTGLVVGAGTKPLHDLVSTIERSKNSK
jgi:hypothetical protein